MPQYNSAGTYRFRQQDDPSDQTSFCVQNCERKIQALPDKVQKHRPEVTAHLVKRPLSKISVD